MKKKVLFILNTDKFLLSHRIEIAKALCKNNYDVHLGSSISSASQEISKLGINIHKISINRSDINPFNLLKTIFSIYKLIKKIKPDIVHFISIKPVILGCIAKKFIQREMKIFASISGLGYIFVQDSFLGQIKKIITCLLYRFSLSNKKLKVIFQNNDDKKFLMKICNLSENQTILIKGSGIDLEKFKPLKKESSQKIVLLPARVVKSKGIFEFLMAAEILKDKGKFILCGDLDYEAKDYIKLETLKYWIKNSFVEYIGYRKDMHQIINEATIIVLPSYREGLPKVLCEAAACGKPIVTTNVPGCRDAILDNKTGFLVPHKNVPELVKSINLLLDNPYKVESMGLAGRKFAIDNFDVKEVVDKHIKLYKE